MTDRAKQGLLGLAKLSFALGLIGWMIHKGAIDFSALGRLFTATSLILGLSLIFALIFINNYRWLILLKSQQFVTTVRETLPLSLIGIFFNYAVPGGVGGDVVKGYYLLRQHRDRRMSAAISILFDRSIGLFMMIVTAAVALALSWSRIENSEPLRAMALMTGLLALSLIGFALLLFSGRVWNHPFRIRSFAFLRLSGSMIERALAALQSYRNRPMVLVQAMALSLLSQLTVICFVYFIALSMGETGIPFSAYFFLVPVGLVATSLPLSPAGVGVGQAAFYFLFNAYLGQVSQVGPTAITALQVTQFLWGLLGAFFYLRRGSRGRLEGFTNYDNLAPAPEAGVPNKRG